MEPVQRLIIGNNVYDANDDKLEAEVTPYLNNLIKKQKTAKDGKAAIITATQNKTGKHITTNTYAEVVDKLEEIRFGTFNVQNLRFKSTYAGYTPVPTYYQEIIDNKIVRFNNWETLTDIGSVAFIARYPRTILHKPPNASDAMTLSIQVNLDFSSAVADTTPILSVSSENYASYNTVTLTKVDNNTIKIKYVYIYDMSSRVDTITVPDLSGYNYFGVDIICLANDKIRINMYGGVRQESETSMSGYIPSNKVLLFSRTYDSKFNSYVLVNDAAILLNICGNERHIDDESTFAQTALHFQDYGIRLVDPYTTSVVGNTNFLDMEVTS